MSDEKDYKNGPISSTLVRDVEEVGEKDVFAVNSSSENVITSEQRDGLERLLL